MITKDNFKDLLALLEFEAEQEVYSKHFPHGDFYLKVDFNKHVLIYPEDKGFTVNERQTCNFSSSENFVVFECVHRLLMKGYKPEHIELEPKWKLGHGASGGRADVFVRDQQKKPLLIIECKTAGKEFDRAWKDTLLDGAQLFSYIEQEKDIEFVCLYASDFDDKTSTLNIEQRIISHKDNEKILADDPKLKGFKDAKNVKERFKVWKETYQLEFTEKGIFEENIQPYQIGKDKYTLDIDTKIIDANDIKGKYHQFRTILRKYNVSRRENAFEVLVNLFLCKIVDEVENPNDLKFYWKGIAYDNYFDLVDRLQELYKIGMDKFLHQEIVYVSNKEIDEAFWAIKQKRNATKQRIKEIFRELKFYKGLDFEFIKVFNKKYFDKNAKVLLEIIQMWQGLRLKTKEQNQFLGDMFEFFLDNGIKQTEGQFFTPVPICKFIVMSLPLEHQIKEGKEALKVIDYACGSGHFLTEYALQIKPLVKQHKQTEPAEYYKGIYGIEKEDRLAKVAKVSAFMYGRDEINVIDADALATNPEIKDENFDVLIANPPFAVEDFLLTLEESDREKYELLSSVSDLGNKNIQCFFLERAKQLLAGNGVMGVIVPSSVLSNSDGMHIATREILLKYFDFVSIVELGSNTFGKTGTNTVILFLRRKPQRPEPAVQFWNRTLDFFDNWAEEIKTGGGAYMDTDTVKKYCQHIEVPFEEYQTLLTAAPSAALLATEMFEDYKADFNNLNEIKKLKEAKQFKAKPKATQEAELTNRFLNYLQEIEKQKLYYFILASSNPQKVLIVKSPSESKEQKQFLGYEWSGAKGSEGIKYNGGDTIHDIITPMFDPRDRNNAQKVNFLIQQNFQAGLLSIPKELQPFISLVCLEDLLEFRRKDFNKAFSLSPKKITSIETKWEIVRIEEVCEKITDGTHQTPTYSESGIVFLSSTNVKTGKIDWENIKYISHDLHNELSKRVSPKVDDVLLAKNGTTGVAAIVDRDLVFDIYVSLALLRANHRILPKYLLHIINTESTKEQFNSKLHGMGVPNLHLVEIKSVKIPLPPLEVQQQIVAECEGINQAVNEAQAKITEMIRVIEGKVVKNAFPKDKMANIAKRISDNIDPQSKIGEVNYIGLENIESNTGSLVGNVKTEYQTIKSAKTCFKEGDILYGKLRPNLNKVYLAKEDGICSTDILVFRFEDQGLAKYYFYYLLSKQFNQEVLKSVSGQQLPRTSWTDMKEIKILVPPPLEQPALIAEIEALEQQINAAQKVVSESASQKEAIMKKYLSA